MREQTYIFRHLQNSEHKEDVLLSVLQLFVLEAPVGLCVSECELAGQVFEVRRDVGFGFCLPAEAKASARLVYLLQQLQGGGRRLITHPGTHDKTSTHTKICQSRFPSDCQVETLIAKYET